MFKPFTEHVVAVVAIKVASIIKEEDHKMLN
jgi:hypothetical protein